MEGTSSVVTASDWSAVISSITAQINVETVVGALAVVVTGGIGLYFMWWGLRKAARVLMDTARGRGLRF